LHLEARDLPKLVFCVVRTDQIDMPVVYVTLTMKLRKTPSVRCCALVRLL